MTALKKGANRVRGIVAGAVLRRLTCKAVAQQFSEELLRATEPWQYALSTRAGTDCVGHSIRAMTDFDADLTVLSVDGVGAYDHVSRARMFEELWRVPELRELLPFVRLWMGKASLFVWTDDAGRLLFTTFLTYGSPGASYRQFDYMI